MNIGLVDVDGHNFPNFALMKISSYHKKQGHLVEWANPLLRRITELDMEYAVNLDPVSSLSEALLKRPSRLGTSSRASSLS